MTHADLTTLTDDELAAYAADTLKRERAARDLMMAANKEGVDAALEIARRKSPHNPGDIILINADPRKPPVRCVVIGMQAQSWGGIELCALPILKNGRLGYRPASTHRKPISTAFRWTGALTPGATGEVVEVTP